MLANPNRALRGSAAEHNPPFWCSTHLLPLLLCALWHCLRRPISRDDHKLGVVEQILLNVSHSLLVPRDVFPYKDRACMEWCACNFVSMS